MGLSYCVQIPVEVPGMPGEWRKPPVRLLWKAVSEMTGGTV